MLRRLASFFRRQSGAMPEPKDAENWHPGDLAKCINDGAWLALDGSNAHGGSGPTFDEQHIVTKVWPANSPMIGGPCQALEFSRWTTKVFTSSSFVKITPRADHAVAADGAFLSGLIDPPIHIPPEKV